MKIHEYEYIIACLGLTLFPAMLVSVSIGETTLSFVLGFSCMFALLLTCVLHSQR
jgi:hypothetical protein